MICLQATVGCVTRTECLRIGNPPHGWEPSAWTVTIDSQTAPSLLRITAYTSYMLRFVFTYSLSRKEGYINKCAGESLEHCYLLTFLFASKVEVIAGPTFYYILYRTNTERIFFKFCL